MKVTNENLKEVGAYLKAKRKERGLTTYDMLMKFGIHRHTLNSIENGENYTAKILLRYCEAVGVKITLSNE